MAERKNSAKNRSENREKNKTIPNIPKGVDDMQEELKAGNKKVQNPNEGRSMSGWCREEGGGILGWLGWIWPSTGLLGHMLPVSCFSKGSMNRRVKHYRSLSTRCTPPWYRTEGTGRVQLISRRPGGQILTTTQEIRRMRFQLSAESATFYQKKLDVEEKNRILYSLLDKLISVVDVDTFLHKDLQLTLTNVFWYCGCQSKEAFQVFYHDFIPFCLQICLKVWNTKGFIIESKPSLPQPGLCKVCRTWFCWPNYSSCCHQLFKMTVISTPNTEGPQKPSFGLYSGTRCVFTNEMFFKKHQLFLIWCCRFKTGQECNGVKLHLLAARDVQNLGQLSEVSGYFFQQQFETVPDDMDLLLGL